MEWIISNLSWNMLAITLVLMICCSVLNRLRGTGLLYSFGTISNLEKYTFNKVDKLEVKVVWNHIYALYLSIIIGVLVMDGYGLYAGISVFILYIIGESKGWGEWVGALCNYDTHKMDEKWLLKQYEDKEGKGFPFIFAIANFFIKEKIEGEAVSLNKRISHYLNHATLALILRGHFWYILIFFIPYFFNLLNIIEYISIVWLLSISFPIACYLGKITDINGKLFIVEYSRGWHNQELYNGLFQGIAIAYLVIINI